MSERLKAWFAPGTVITLITIFASAVGGYYATRSDIRSLAERQDRTEHQLQAIEAKMPDGAQIDQRFRSIEQVTNSTQFLDLLANVRVQQAELKRLDLEQRLLRDYVEGRISALPYRRPPNDRK